MKNRQMELFDVGGSTGYRNQEIIDVGQRGCHNTPANDLTRYVINRIKAYGGFAERITVMGRPVEQRDATGRIRGVFWTKGQMTRGSADISAIINGRAVRIEVKAGADRQSEAQKIYERNVVAAGGIYLVARTEQQITHELELLWGTL